MSILAPTTPSADPQAAAPFALEFAPELLEQIRVHAVDTLRMRREDAAGILFGVRGARQIKVVSWRPIRCSHFYGPQIKLTESEEAGLVQMSNERPTHPELGELHVAGWFVSHVRGGLALTDVEGGIFERVFPWSWQRTLLIAPAADGSASAAMILRNRVGGYVTDTDHGVITLAAPKAEPKASAVKSWIPGQPALWILWITAALLSLVAVSRIAGPSSGAKLANPGLTLSMTPLPGRMAISWDPNAGVVVRAMGGSLDLVSGKKTFHAILTPERLREGRIEYPASGDLSAELTLSQPLGRSIKISGLYLEPVTGTPVRKPAQQSQEQDRLKTELAAAHEALAREAKRNRELQDLVRILETRLHIKPN